jgi:hypothetical protein
LAKPGWSRTLEEDWYSPVYGAREKSAAMRLRAHTRLPADFATVLEVLPDKTRKLGSLVELHEAALAPSLRAYRYLVQDRSSYFFLNQSGRAWAMGEFASDARFLYYETKTGGEKLLFFSHGSYVRLGGFPTLSCQGIVERCEVRDSPAGIELRSTGQVARLGRLPDLDHATQPIPM